MGRNRRKFTPEFKAEAVGLVEASGGNIAEGRERARDLCFFVVEELGRQAREEAAGAPSVEEHAEIRDLKRELDRVRGSGTSSAKAVAFFSASTREERVMAVYGFIAGEKAAPNVSGGSRRCVGRWRSRVQGSMTGPGHQPSAREIDDGALTVEIQAIWEASDRTSGHRGYIAGCARRVSCAANR